MTRKDYEHAAEQIRKTNYSKAVKAAVVDAFTEFFHRDNPRFSEDRFIEACYKLQDP